MIDTTRLSKLKPYANGGAQAQCPACHECGSDRSGNHLRIWPDGKFGCAVHAGDAVHRRRIWELAGGAGPMPVERRPPIRPNPPVNCTRLWREWLAETQPPQVDELARNLGVDAMALEHLGCAWCSCFGCWAVPMWDEWNECIGIQLRWADGFKKTLAGSRNGMFVPRLNPQSTACITEGASDCASALSLGLYAIGRHSCSDNPMRINACLKRLRVTQVIIIADPDTPGIAGAGKLAEALTMPCCIYVPPAEDFRCAVRSGLTRALFDATVATLAWRQPK